MPQWGVLNVPKDKNTTSLGIGSYHVYMFGKNFSERSQAQPVMPYCLMGIGRRTPHDGFGLLVRYHKLSKKRIRWQPDSLKKIHVTVWSTSSPRRQVNINNTAQFLSSTCLLIITESGGRVMAEYLTTGLQIVTGFIEKGAGTVTKRVERPRQA